MLQNYNLLKVASIFFQEPTKRHYLIEISKKANLAHTSVKNYLNELIKLKIIKQTIEIKGKRKFPEYSANLYEKNYKENKKIYNLIFLKDSGVIDFMRDELMPKTVVLFGSYQKGEDIETSDIDIYLQTKESKINLSKFEKKLNRKIQLHFKKEFKAYPNELKNNIINGTILSGYLEAI